MIKIDKYIADLLMEHQFVLVPDFGAFIGHYKASEISTENMMIYPPSMNLAFNPALKSDDGLLKHYIARKESISYMEALELIRLNVREWDNMLQNNHAVRINKLGEIRNNEDQKLIFSPYNTFNFNLNSFGYKEIPLKPVVRRNLALDEKIYLEINKSSVIRNHKKGKFAEKRRIVYYSVALYLPILISLWAFFLIKEPFTVQQSSLNVLAVATNVDLPTGSVSDVKELPSLSESKNSEKDNEISVKAEKSSPKTNEEAKYKTAVYYYVIGGCFKEYGNAEAFYGKLVHRFEGSEILPDQNSFYRVSYGKFSDLHQANDFLYIIREKENSSAWILKQ